MEKLYDIDDINTAKIDEIAGRFIKSNLSLRKFSAEFCSFSYVTLREKFLTILPYVNQTRYKKILEILNNHREKKVNEDESIKKKSINGYKVFSK